MRIDNYMTIAAYRELRRQFSDTDSLQRIERNLQLKALHISGGHYLFYHFSQLPGVLETNEIMRVLWQIAETLELKLSPLPDRNKRLTQKEIKVLATFGYKFS